MKRKLRLKKKALVVILLFVVLVFSFLLLLNKTNSPKKSIKKKVDYISLLSSYDEFRSEQKFLEWILKKYGENVLSKLNKSLDEETYDKSIWHKLTGKSYIVLRDLYENNYANMDNVKYIDKKKAMVDISFVGDVSLADNWGVMPQYNSRGKGVYGILSDDVVKYMNNSDWTVVNSEFVFSNNGSPLPNKLYTFRGNPKNISIYDEMGVNMVTLANNHVYDYGREAFLDTLNTFKEHELPYIGAGVNSDEALKNYYLVSNGYKISFLNASRAEKYIMTPEADSDNPGIFRCYDPSTLVNRIKEEKEKSDYVVVILHWGKEDSHMLEDVQKETGKLYIDSGADLIVGHHAHVLQGMELYNDKLIAYNLGNFIFCGLTQETGILTWRLNYDGTSEFYFKPALQEDYYTSFLEGDNSKELYSKMEEWSINVDFLEDGKVMKRG